MNILRLNVQNNAKIMESSPKFVFFRNLEKRGKNQQKLVEGGSADCCNNVSCVVKNV